MNNLNTTALKGQCFSTMGNADLLARRMTGLLCSRKCPADRILEAYERFKQWAADPSITIISGFHSPVEKECLRLLLKGKANIIICPAREIEHMRIPSDWESAMETGRMLILSPFSEKRATARTIDSRNRLVADLANELYVPYAAPGGNLVQFDGEQG